MALPERFMPQSRTAACWCCMCAIQNRRLLVLHVFVKKTQTTPRKALLIAQQRLETGS